ncbi:hypothetical protein P0E83_03440 [Enterococcus faecalis]|nr:hypothetical protein [Enterococcus faecalis]
MFGYFDDSKIKSLESELFVVVQEVEYHKRFWNGTQHIPEKWVVSVMTEDGENYRQYEFNKNPKFDVEDRVKAKYRTLVSLDENLSCLK